MADRHRLHASGSGARAALGLLCLGLVALPATPVTAGGTEVTPKRQQALRHLLLHDCGSCHGLSLRGGLGPALTPVALRAAHPDMLVATILNGRPGTPMPPWRGLLTEPEARWLVDTMKSGRVQ